LGVSPGAHELVLAGVGSPPRETAQEGTMAKGQNRGNREPKKPKSKKPASGPTLSILSPKGINPQSNLPKKKP
jgi:hypothetical protein